MRAAGAGEEVGAGVKVGATTAVKTDGDKVAVETKLVDCESLTERLQAEIVMQRIAIPRIRLEFIGSNITQRRKGVNVYLAYL